MAASDPQPALTAAQYNELARRAIAADADDTVSSGTWLAAAQAYALTSIAISLDQLADKYGLVDTLARAVLSVSESVGQLPNYTYDVNPRP